MTLDYWQEHLEKHFTALRERRTSALGEKPLFALEHGLSEAERTDLAAQIKQSAPQSRLWLPWTVYAAELGYDYDGDEYWQSFEKKTPRWLAFGQDRSWIRDCYWKFYKQFGGARPSGRWAQHFTNICWPIKHAILPVDLQRRLAEILYEIRFSFRPELFESPELLGAEIAARSWRASSRFQNLAEEPLLVGQIAAALLLREEELSRSLILPATLLRIAKDLESERHGREWLKDAQAVARARMTGVVRVPTGGLEPARRPDSEELRSLGIEPSVFLRPTQSGGWDVVLEIPDLAPLLHRFPQLQRVLNESPCVVAGSSGRPLARGRLLHYGPQTVVLKRWPAPNEVLLRFETPVPELDYLLSAECMLRPGPKWLFKLSPDGVAYEIRGKVIRPKGRYIVLSNEGPLELGDGTIAIALGCEGISAAYMDVPGILDEEELEYLKLLGLSPATGVHIQPVGIPPVKWDGEGHVEWLSTDQPCISVSSDRPVSAICLNLEGPNAATAEIPLASPGEVVFVELGQLSRGSHRLHLLVQSPDTPNQLLSGYVDVSIRDPRPWTKGLTDQNPLIVIVDPPNPTLEQLWSGRVTLELHGPPGRQVSCLLTLRQRRVGKTSVPRSLPALSLPVDIAAWRAYFAKVQESEALQNEYDTAAKCELTFNAGEIGQFTLICERELIPLRWILREENHGYVLQLQDDTGGPAAAVVAYDFLKPDLPVAVNSDAFMQDGFRVSPEGGLYLAKNSQHQSGVVVPPVIRSLAELRLEPELSKRTRSSEALADLLSSMELWSNARVTGNLLSMKRQGDILARMTYELLELVCGGDWVALEKELAQNRDQIVQFKSLIGRGPSGTSLGAALFLKRNEIVKESMSDRVKEFSRLVGNYLEVPALLAPGDAAADRLWMAEFALRMATWPSTLPAWSAGHISRGTEYMLKSPSVARAARLLALSVSSSTPGGHSPLVNPTDWVWQ